MLYPLTFFPIFKERIWGGRNLERLYHKKLPPQVSIGESWEISDRPGDESVIANGPFEGRTLRWLLENHRAEVLGENTHLSASGRFPLLIKLLDAQEKLSLQVHPPASKAKELGGEPKTEMWYVADAKPEADLFVGLKHGTTRAEFEKRIQDGTVADCFHRITVKKDDVMFLPSGRVHALGAGNVIFEIQQNSDTTYRVFDWNRVDANGKPRDLHIKQSLESIDFNDFEPALAPNKFTHLGFCKVRTLAKDPLFTVIQCDAPGGEELKPHSGTMLIYAVLHGTVSVECGPHKIPLSPGHFCLIPAAIENVALQCKTAVSLLRIQAG
jgi:mannose-6-phosphate isomerase